MRFRWRGPAAGLAALVLGDTGCGYLVERRWATGCPSDTPLGCALDTDHVAAGASRLLRAIDAGHRHWRGERVEDPMDPPFVADLQSAAGTSFPPTFRLMLHDAPKGSVVALAGGTAYSPWDAFLVSIIRPDFWRDPAAFRRSYDGWWVKGVPLTQVQQLAAAGRPPGTDAAAHLIRTARPGEVANVALCTVPLTPSPPSSMPPPSSPLPTEDFRFPRFPRAAPLVTAAVTLRDLKVGDELIRTPLTVDPLLTWAFLRETVKVHDAIPEVQLTGPMA